MSCFSRWSSLRDTAIEPPVSKHRGIAGIVSVLLRLRPSAFKLLNRAYLAGRIEASSIKNPNHLILLTVLLFGAISSAHADSPTTEATASAVPVADTSPRPVVIVVPGLNNNQRMMDSLAEAIEKCGAITTIVSLTGHRPSDSEWPDVDYKKAWRTDLEQAVADAHLRHPGSPIAGAGFSLGALLLMDRALTHPDDFFGMLLFAPPLALKYSTAAVRLLLPFRWLIGNLPSRSPDSIRAHSSTSLRAYRGSIKLHDEIVDTVLDHPGSMAVPGRVYISDDDEIIDAEEVRERIAEGKLPFTVMKVTPTRAVGDDTLQHLVPMSGSYSEDAWIAIERDLCASIDKFSKQTAALSRRTGAAE